MNKIYHITPESKYDNELLEELCEEFRKDNPDIIFDFSSDNSINTLKSFRDALMNKINNNIGHPLYEDQAMFFICEDKKYTLHFTRMPFQDLFIGDMSHERPDFPHPHKGGINSF